MTPSTKSFDGKVVFRQIANSPNETVYQATMRKYPNYAENFAKRFTMATGKGFVWKNITPANVEMYVQFLCDSGLSKNSVNQYCKKLKAVVGLYKDQMHIDGSVKDILTTPTDDSFFVYINDEEVNILVNYLDILKKRRGVKLTKLGKIWSVDHDSRQIDILKQFIVGLFTGARRSDYINFSWKNISMTLDSEGNPIHVLTYTSKKTGIVARVPLPLDSPAIEIISNMPREKYALGVFNTELRQICKDAGLDRKVKYHHAGKDIECLLYEAITSHSARRSFASNYLSDGADIIDVMQFMGHSNPQQTIGYNCAGPKFDSRIIRNRYNSKTENK